MSRWKIEKDGTGIEKSGTGIEKSGTGIEKSGTGIEKSGTGIEKSGSGLRRIFAACSVAVVMASGSAYGSNQDPGGSLQLVTQENKLAVSWIVDGSVFAGVASINGSFASVSLTELSLSNNATNVEVTGNGTGSAVMVTGNGTGGQVQVTGNGTGGQVQVTGNGTGLSVQVTGNGTGSSTMVTGNGTGSATLVTGNGTGRSVEITGNGTGTEAITITLPNGTGLAMEVSMGCGSAAVTVLDTNSVPVVAFDDVPVIGDTGFCNDRFVGGAIPDPGRDFRSR